MLHDNGWIDHWTRSANIELTLFNAPTKLFIILDLTFIVTATGAISPSHMIWVCKLYTFTDVSDLYTFVCELAYIIILLLQTKDLLERERKRFFKSVGNIVDLMILLASLLGIIMYSLKIYIVSNALKASKSVKDYQDVLNAAMSHNILIYVIAVTLALVVLRYISLLGLNRKIYILSQVVRHSANPIVGYYCLFFSCLLAYVVMGNQALGSVLEMFSTIPKTILMLCNLLVRKTALGDVGSYGKIVYAMSLFYFITFLALIVGIWIPMIQSILLRALTATRVKVDDLHQLEQVMFYMRDYFKNVFICKEAPSRELHWETLKYKTKLCKDKRQLNTPDVLCANTDEGEFLTVDR